MEIHCNWSRYICTINVFKSIFTKYIIKVLDNIFKALKIKSARKFLIAFEQPIKMAFIVMGVYIFLSILNSSMEWHINSIINKLLGTSIIVLFANGLINITNNSDEFLFRATDKYDIKVNTVLIPMMVRGIKYLIIAFPCNYTDSKYLGIRCKCFYNRYRSRRSCNSSSSKRFCG